MSRYLAAAHLALTLAILLWNILVAGRIARTRAAPPVFAGISAIAGLIIAPALIIELATSTTLYGRALHAIAWLWVAITVLIAVQSTYATVQRLVSPLIGAPIAVYNVLLALGAITSFAIQSGVTPPSFLLLLPVAERSALGVIVGSFALSSPLYLFLPMLAPAFPSRYAVTSVARVVLAVLAVGAIGLTLAHLWDSRSTVRSYDQFARAQLTERLPDDFRVGLRLFPDLAGPPPPVAVRNDLALADTLVVRAISIVLEPEGVTRAALDSLSHTLDELRQGGARLFVTLGYPAVIAPGAMPPQRLDEARRIILVELIARRLRPDYLLPALEPYGEAVRAVGQLPLQRWAAYLTEAARVAQGANPRTRVGVSASSFSRQDSALYAWAASDTSPLAAVGFSLAPGRRGARLLTAGTGAAERWMRVSKSRKEHWVFSVRGYPRAHGEVSQERALWGALAWATSQPGIKGIILADAADYRSATGLRAPDGRIRIATYSVRRAVRALREVAPDSVVVRPDGR